MDTLSIYLSDIFEVAQEQRFVIACILTSGKIIDLTFKLGRHLVNPAFNYRT
jgi:hypothetical protein